MINTGHRKQQLSTLVQSLSSEQKIQWPAFKIFISKAEGFSTEL